MKTKRKLIMSSKVKKELETFTKEWFKKKKTLNIDTFINNLKKKCKSLKNRKKRNNYKSVTKKK